MNGAFADLAGLSMRLELLSHLLQKLVSTALVDRLGQGEHDRHFFVG
jgi:hypothetical protein